MKTTAYFTERFIVRKDRKRIRNKFLILDSPEYTRYLDEKYEKRRKMTKAGWKK